MHRETMRFVSYDIQYGMGLDGKINLTRTSGEICQAGATTRRSGRDDAGPVTDCTFPTLLPGSRSDLPLRRLGPIDHYPAPSSDPRFS